MIGFLYPAYFSLVAINSKDREDDTKWYVCLVFSLFSGLYTGLSLVSLVLLNRLSPCSPNCSSDLDKLVVEM